MRFTFEPIDNKIENKILESKNPTIASVTLYKKRILLFVEIIMGATIAKLAKGQ